MSTLYRKYRPQNFEEVVGQNHIKITLTHEIEAEKIAHAYLFCGPRAVGKTTLARVFAKSVNCLDRKDGTYESCGKCSNCLEINEAKSIDLIEIDAASHTGVDNVRENIINASRVTPTKSKYKVFIIDEVHMLSISAFNALLKIIEEPPQHVIFILCTTEIHKVPSTIISRCQRFDFKKINILDMVTKLNYIAQKEGLDIDKKVLESIARKSDGYMRDAESLFGQIISVSGSKKITQEDAELIVPGNTYEEAVSLIEFISSKDVANSITLINKLLDDGINLKNFLDDLIEVLRKLMFVKVSPSLDTKIGTELVENLEQKISKISKNIELNQIINSIEQFSDAKLKIKNSFIVQLPLEVAVIKICTTQTFQSNQFEKTKTVTATAPVLEPKKVIADQVDSPVVEKTINSSVDISLEEVNSRWNEVLAQVKKINHSLVFVIQASKPIEIAGSILKLSTKYKFHKDRIEDISIRALIEKVLHDVFGHKLAVEVTVDDQFVSQVVEVKKNEDTIVEETSQKNNNEEEGKNGNMMNNLLKNFGGKIVNT
ncbi:MAG: DNA polymerase III subunit gamma/tau [Patescibacteria group bacterium]|jgi:DNA polymerase-3 subunit gamma/tau|nr:DNA polymerase III subunit gamma/tau [Patescibacteria group bacterium]